MKIVSNIACDVLSMARIIRSGRRSAVSVMEATIEKIRHHDGEIHSVTSLLEEEALTQARQVDEWIARGESVPLLAGVPFGVKDLFDLAGHVTTAGSVVLCDNLPARKDATVVARLRAAGAIPVATLNMDEFAYGFATDNAHYGLTHNPHDTGRMAGGSSGGAAAAVAAGFLPFTLGSDTNGSIRVPASLCGVWGLKPTYGTVPLEGVYPFSASLDVAGPFANTLEGLKTIYQIMAQRELLPESGTVRTAFLGGWFSENLSASLQEALEKVRTFLKNTPFVELPYVRQARAASFLITASEGGNLHLPRLRAQAEHYDPTTRDRLLAGALLPVHDYLMAQRFRRWFRGNVHKLFENYDVLIAPAVMGEAPELDAPFVTVEGKKVSARANLGLYTQPLSLTGLPVLCLPLAGNETLPLGLQLVGAPGQEGKLFTLAGKLEEAGLAGSHIKSF